ncbi:restriction endonuclease [Vibrio owensii]|uniref:restriction endonuclease n=1 Tax=Vibrio owensii TaxID=696485 RepID=UPI0022DE6E8A|nr:restriction endonuclease [Vibrio owensii]MDA0385192.1 restriction endonuclease [Vibrio owensii]
MWMIRAGERAYLIDTFKDKGCVSIGWSELGDLSEVTNETELKTKYLAEYPDQHSSKSSNAIAMVKKFRFDIKVGDRTISYDPARRIYLVGNITSDYRYEKSEIDDSDFNHIRKVEWIGEVSRDDLSISTRNTLGSTLALFAVNNEVTKDFELILKSGRQPHIIHNDEPDDLQEEEINQSREDVIEQSRELIKDRVIKTSPEGIEELVAGVLRAMGYRTIVSPKGVDRGVDIVASPDGLGLESPRIKVEVKHRKGTIGAPDVRSFIGGLRSDDRALYISTGGFTKEAKYEADRANVPVMLIDLDTLLNLIISHYDDFDIDTRVLLPLAKIYWPK